MIEQIKKAGDGMIKLAVIADDLTGANDTAVQFAKIGMKAFVLLDRTKEMPPDTDVVVVNTDSRGITAAEARSQVRTTCDWLRQWQAQAVIKKLDSTLRGNLGAEIEEAFHQLDCEVAIIVPAFPRAGRITAGGYHLLRQHPVSESEVAHDPKTPVTESRLAAVIQGQTTLQVAHVELASVMQGQAAVAAAIEQCLRRNDQLITFDATTESHLAIIAQAAASTGRRVLWVGSAGLAEVLPAALEWPGTANGFAGPAITAPVLVIAGSMSGMTARQLAHIQSQQDVQVVKVDAAAALRSKEQTLHEYCSQGAKGLTGGRDVVIKIADRSPQAVASAIAAGAELGITADQVSDAIASRLSDMAVALMSYRPGALILTGGDTAVAVCQALAASGICIANEVAPGVPWGYLAGGHHDGLPVVTKAGAFGEDDVFVKALAILKAKENRI